MTVTFTLATREDDAQIRRLLASNPVPGPISLRYEREPDYFAGCDAMGPFTQVLVAKENHRVVGVACRAIRPLYINGQREDVGYLGQLRVDREYRGRFLVPRGFQLLRELHDDARTQGYVTTIIEGNAEAEGILVHRPRGVMPRYRRLGTLVTLALATYPSYPSYSSYSSYSSYPDYRSDSVRPVRCLLSPLPTFPPFTQLAILFPCSTDHLPEGPAESCKSRRAGGPAPRRERAGNLCPAVASHSSYPSDSSYWPHGFPALQTLQTSSPFTHPVLRLTCSPVLAPRRL